MGDYQRIYDEHADAYDALVACEDHEANLPRALREHLPLDGATVLEAGAGTGRVSRLVAPWVRSLDGWDRAPAMIDVARARALAAGHGHLRYGVAAHGEIVFEPGAYTVALEGWAFGHAVSWNPSGWRDEVTAWVRALERSVGEGGHVALIETLGTAVEAPFAGGHTLEPFDAFVCDALKFTRHVVRTDYRFASRDEAEARVRFFFGERTAARVRDRVVPEFTALYVRTV